MGNIKVHYSSLKSDWETPKVVFDPLNKEFRFDLDVCANYNNRKCLRFFNPHNNGLSQKWEGTCWMNPPYGRYITGKWVKKAYESSLEGTTVVCLLPARTSNGWWHDYCMKGEIRFIRGRIKFVGAANSAPFPSAIVIFRGAYLGLLLRAETRRK